MAVKNYTGDVMNFEMAAEMAGDGRHHREVHVVTNDDVAVKDSLYTVGRRGVAGTVFVHKSQAPWRRQASWTRSMRRRRR